MSEPVFPGGIDLVPGPQGPPIPANGLRLVTIGGALYTTTDGITFTAAGGGGGGTIHTSAPLSGDGSVGTPATIAAGAIALSKLATQADQTVVGNVSGGVASPIALSAAQLTALINPASASSPGAMTVAQYNLITYLAGRWENVQEAFLVAKVPSLTGFEYWKPNFTSVNAARTSLGSIGGAAAVVGGAVTGGANAYQQYSAPIYTNLKTSAWGLSVRGKAVIPSSGNIDEFGLTDTAGSHNVAFISSFSNDTTHLLVFLNNTTVITTTHVIDGNAHDYAITFDLTTVTVWVDGVNVGSTTTLTNLTDFTAYFYMLGAATGSVSVVYKVLQGYIAP